MIYYDIKDAIKYINEDIKPFTISKNGFFSSYKISPRYTYTTNVGYFTKYGDSLIEIKSVNNKKFTFKFNSYKNIESDETGLISFTNGLPIMFFDKHTWSEIISDFKDDKFMVTVELYSDKYRRYIAQYKDDSIAQYKDDSGKCIENNENTYYGIKVKLNNYVYQVLGYSYDICMLMNDDECEDDIFGLNNIKKKIYNYFGY